MSSNGGGHGTQSQPRWMGKLDVSGGSAQLDCGWGYYRRGNNGWGYMGDGRKKKVREDNMWVLPKCVRRRSQMVT